MKQTLQTGIFLLFFLLFYETHSQPLQNNLPQQKNENIAELTFYEIQKAFNDYWETFNVKDGYYVENGIRKKAPGWKQFKRWEWFWENRVDPVTGEFPKTSAAEIRKKLRKTAGVTNVGGNWKSMGPSTVETTSVGLGRLNCIAFVDSDNDRFYAGSPSGGLWRTTDGGNSWETLTDDNDVLGVSDILIYEGTSESTDTIYIATGDRDGGSIWSLGGGQIHDNNTIGVLKSTDGGTTWSSTDLEWLPGDKKTVNRLLKHPAGSDSIYAACTDGVFLTTNGGTTWPKLPGTIEFIDMEFKPLNPDIIYGSTRSGAIYKSSDKGATWILKLSVAGAKRIELAVSEDMPGRVYAVVVASTRGLEGIYKSDDSGEIWTKVFDGTISGNNLLGSYCDGTSTGGQGTYDLALATKPDDASTLYVGGINTWKSTDGGSSWTVVNMWTGGPPQNTCGTPVVHADKHWFGFHPGTGEFFEGNDGGMYKSSNGSVWTNLSNGLVIGQIYRIGVSSLTSNNVISGFQDNGTHSLLSGDWTWVISGDGMECLIDYTDDDTQYGSIYYGRLFRTTDGWASGYTEITSNLSGFSAWVTPFAIDPVSNTTLYTARDTVWKSTNQGASWTKISNFDLPAYPNDVFRSMAVAPSGPDTIYVANRSKIWATYNGGTSWTEITGSLPVGSSNITYISVNSDFADTLWVAMGEYNSHGVYQSHDAGATWTNISSGLPSVPVMCVIQNKQNTSEIELYAATDVGVYVKVGDTDWSLYSDGLPNVVVTELEIYYNNTKPHLSRLRAATYGRGLWESELYAPATSHPVTDFMASDTVPLVDSAVIFTDMTVNDPTSWSWTFTPSTVTYLNGTSSTSQNPEVSFDATGDYTVELTATNANGSDTETKASYIFVAAPYKWTGATSSSWTTASNWDSGTVPDETKVVIIEGGATFYPEILDNFYVGSSGSTATCKGLVIKSGGTLTLGAVPVAYFDMLIYGDVKVETGGTLNICDDIVVYSGGRLMITGGTVTNFVNTTGGYGDLYFYSGSSGYMTAGTLTIYSDIEFSGGDWHASGGTFHAGGDAKFVIFNAKDPDIYLNNLVIDEGVTSYISSSSSIALSIHGDFTQEAGSFFSISAGESMNVFGNVLLKSNATGAASLINAGTLNVDGTSTVQRYVTDGQWHLLSSPVSGEKASALYFGGSPEAWLKNYLEPTNTWQYITDITTPLTQGMGFGYWIEAVKTPRADQTISFKGSLRSTDLTLSSLSYSGDALHGYNLVGNPFPSAIDWDIGSWDTTGINGSIYVWEDGGAGNGTGSYLYRNAQGMGSLTDGIIPTAQGFFVQTNNSTNSLTIPADARTHSSIGYYKATEAEENDTDNSYFVLKISDPEYRDDEVWIAFHEGLTDGYDNGWDVNKFFGDDNMPQLYLEENDLKLSIDALPPLTGDERIILLDFEPGQNGEHELILGKVNNMEIESLFLEDLKTGDMTDLASENSYWFSSSKADDPQRFVLHLNALQTGIDEDIPDNSYLVYAYDKSVYIRYLGEDDAGDVLLVDMYGRTYSGKKLLSSGMNVLKTNLRNAYVIVKITNSRGTYVKKVFVQ